MLKRKLHCEENIYFSGIGYNYKLLNRNDEVSNQINIGVSRS